MLLSVNGVTSGYARDNIIIDDVNITVDENETIVVIGPNGAGKSTLLKCVVGLLPSFDGNIILNDVDITNFGASERVRNGISYVAQSANIFSSLTVWENLVLASRGDGRKRGSEDRLDEVMEIFPEIERFKDKPGVLLSGGQRQMVAVAMAMSRFPKLIVMDEPSAGLAPALAKHMFEQIAKVRQRGVSVLLVEQNAYDAIAHCDRGYVLEMGRNAITGSRAELLADDRVERIYLGKSGSLAR